MNNNTYCNGMSMKPGSCSYVRRSEALSVFPQNVSVAMAYVPFQQWGETYSSEKALCQGTIFPCLDKPFLMGCVKC